jgi:Domain of unknown function (DUF5069)
MSSTASLSATAKLKLLAPDLTKPKTYPRSPRETLAGYVIGMRTLDKCRASLAGTLGEYHFNCPVDKMFLNFTGITAKKFQAKVAMGATDEEMAEFVKKNAKARPPGKIIKWNNEQRDRRLSEMPLGIQEYMETYIPQFVPKNRVVHVFFDVYDIEEQRI